jgi:uncharacterized tellurite resistance protein B-like protein
MARLIGLAIGSAVGLAAGGVWLGLMPALGFIAGWTYDRQNRFRDPLEEHESKQLAKHAVSKAEIDRQAREFFARYLTSLFVRVAEVDGPLRREEVGAIRSFFADNLGFDAAELEQVRQELHRASETPQPIRLACTAAAETMSPAERSLLLYALWNVAAADHPVSVAEVRLLDEIGQLLKLDPEVISAMTAGLASVGSGYARLGGAPGSTSTSTNTNIKSDRSESRTHSRREPEREPEPEPKRRAPEPEPEPGPSYESASESEFDAEGESWSYERLGLQNNASEDEVKQAYRRLAQKLHPDKVAHLGPQAVELAGKAFARINEAYERIRKQRGF